MYVYFWHFMSEVYKLLSGQLSYPHSVSISENMELHEREGKGPQTDQISSFLWYWQTISHKLCLGQNYLLILIKAFVCFLAKSDLISG